ncbi:MAG: Rho-binding antiterminator [Pseudomonadota bacterium]
MITCDQYDYIEIVCLYRYPVRLTLKTGARVDGTAIDTGRNPSGAECLQLSHEGDTSLVPLDDITRLDVCVENPHVQSVSFLE